MAIDNGVKRVILIGNKGECYEEQKEIMTTSKDGDLKCEILVKDKFGHCIHEDLDKKIDEALEYIFS